MSEMPSCEAIINELRDEALKYPDTGWLSDLARRDLTWDGQDEIIVIGAWYGSIDVGHLAAIVESLIDKKTKDLTTRLERAEEDRVKLRNRLDAMRRQRDGYRNQLRKTEQLKHQNTDELRRPPMPDTPLNPDAVKAARLVYGGLTECEAASDCDECQVEAGEIIRAYLAVTQQEVNTVEELDQLPIGTVILDGEGSVVWQLLEKSRVVGSEWGAVGEEMTFTANYLKLPARVLYRPEVNDA